TRAIKVNPKFTRAYYKRAFAHSMLKDYAAAVKDYSAVISKNPKHTWSYISRGSSFNKLKKYDLAVTDFDKALEIDPTNQEAYNNRGWAKLGLDDKKGACKDWKKSRKMGNGEAKIILENNHCK
ncbi:MAG TPA: tetratricopeptide repeat protein, partial [Phycisphaerales bacterium]|nr:tetratricopeptide repeat protein [Phycisphaerales bacterium]